MTKSAESADRPSGDGTRDRRPSSRSAGTAWSRRYGRPAAALDRGRRGRGLAAIVTVTALTLTGGSGQAPHAVAAHTATSPSPHEKLESVTGDPDEIPDAVPYFKTKDPDGKVVEHVTDVRRSGQFVRVYTDLGEDDENSKPAVDLCKWTTQFLEDGGDDEPRVFVHGKSDDNGSVVLANKQSDKDDCEVGETR